MFGYRIKNEAGLNQFLPSAQAYVLYKSFNFTEKTDGEINTGISSSINCVFFSRQTKSGIIPGQWYGLDMGMINPYIRNGVWVIKYSNFDGKVYAFMPSADVTRITGVKEKWGARFYDENGNQSFVGTQKPLRVVSFVENKPGTPFNGTLTGNDYHAIPCGFVGQARIPTGSAGWLIFETTISILYGKVTFKFYHTGEAPGGGGWTTNHGNVPLIDVRDYD